MSTDRLRRPNASCPRVAVIGGGVTGLVAARHLALAGVDVAVFEATDRWGGELRTIRVDGLPIDVGAEALHLGAPAGVDLLTDLDLTDRIVRATPAPTWLYGQGRLRALPAAFGPAGPTRLWPLVRSGILSPYGVVRASALLRQLRDPARFTSRCGTCEYATVCGGSRSHANAVTGDPLGDDPSCRHVPARGVVVPS